MKRLIALLALLGACSLAAPVIAQDKPAAPAAEAKAAEAKPAEAAPAAPAAAAAAPAPAPVAAAAAPAPVPNKGDTAWMIVATVLVILMTIPGLALFYGGLVRAKNMLSVLMQVFVTFCMIAVLWVFYGYSIAFTEGNAFFGGFSRLFLSGINGDSAAATFSKGVVIPEYIFVVFQLTFAAITPCLIVGAFVERVKFSGCCCSSPSGLPLPICRWRTWSGTGPARTRISMRPQLKKLPQLPVGCSRKGRSISPAALWCISTPVSPLWSAPT